MIFDCPHCGAGNSVPASMIPSGGHVVSCRACEQRYRVVVDESPESATDSMVEAVAEQTIEEFPDSPLSDSALQDMPVEHTAISGVSFDDESGVVPSEDDFGADEATLSPDAPDRTAADLEMHALESNTMPIEQTPPREEGSTVSIGRPPSQIDDVSHEDAAGLDDVYEQADTVLRDPASSDVHPVPRTMSSQSGPSSPSATPQPSRRGPALETPRRSRARGASNSVRVTPASSSEELYARIAEGRDLGTPAVAPSPSRPKTKAWNERSQVRAMPGAVRVPTVLRRAAERLDGAPLSVKVWLVVFPLALGVLLVLNPLRSKDEKAIVLPIQPEAVRPEIVQPAPVPPPTAIVKPPATEPSKPAPTAEPTKVDAPSPPDAPLEPTPKIGRIDDAPAAEGHAYVQSDDTRLRSRAEARADVVATLSAATEVRRYEAVGAYEMVMVLPDGPVGFVSRDALDSKKPLKLLAEQLNFRRCRASDHFDADDCLDHAEAQLAVCLGQCTSPRCEQACQLALSDCSKSCRPR